MKWWGARHGNEVAPLGLLLAMDWDRLKYLFVAWLSEPLCAYCAKEVAFRIFTKYWLEKHPTNNLHGSNSAVIHNIAPQ